MTEEAILERSVRHGRGDRRMSANTAGAEQAATPLTQRAGRIVGRAGILIPFVIAFVVLAVISPPFLRLGNLTNILDQQAGIIIVACAGTFVLIAGGIDLSIGAIYGLAGAVALTTASSVSPVAGVLAGLAVGLAVGHRQRRHRHPVPDQPAHRNAGDVVRRQRHRGDRDQGQPRRGLRPPGLPAVRGDPDPGHHERGLDDDRHRDRGDDPAEPDDIRALRVRHRREHPGGPARRRPHERHPGRDVRPERDGGGRWPGPSTRRGS